MLSFVPLVGAAVAADDGRMFPVYCPRHGQLVLLPYGHIRVENTVAGIEVHFRCTCGHDGMERMGVVARTASGDVAAA